MFKKIVISLSVVLFITSMNVLNAQTIPMTFRNGSPNHIYMSIPGVWEAKLLPKSTMGFNLANKQKVYFYPNGKTGNKELLFTVNNSWTKDTVLQIDELIEKRKNLSYDNQSHKH